MTAPLPGPGAGPGVRRPDASQDGVSGDVVELSRVPDLGPLYARGLAGSAEAAVRRRRSVRPGALPTARVAVRGVAADPIRLTEYQHLVGETASDVLPAGYVHVLAFPVSMALMVRHDFPLPLLGVVHVANHVEQRRPVRLGESLDVVVGAADLRAHRAGVTVDLVAEAVVDGEPVWRGVSTYLAKGMRLTDGSTTPSSGDLSGAERDRVRDAPDSSGASGESGAAGRPTGRWRLASDTGRRYAAVSGDRNPIHTSALAARAFGFPRAIAHGMYTAARLLADIGRARGDAFTWDVAFAKPVLLPGSATVHVGRLADGGHRGVVRDARGGSVHLSATVTPLD